MQEEWMKERQTYVEEKSGEEREKEGKMVEEREV